MALVQEKKKEQALPDLSVVVRKRGRPRKEKSIDMLPLTVGLALRQARLAKHMKIPSVSKKLRIKESYLEALENGHYHVFPALVYGIGFLRSYATFLGLDANEMVDRFHKETMDIKEEPLEMPRNHDPKIMPSKKVIIRSLIALFLLYFIWNLFQALTEKPFPELKLPEVSSEASFDEGEKTVVPVTAPQIETESQKPAPVPPAPPKRMPVVYGLKQAARISFVATETTKIEIKDTETDSVLLSKTLEKGDRYNPDQDSEGLVLQTTNAGGLDIYIDGKKVRTLGKKGQTKTGVLMDVESLKD